MNDVTRSGQFVANTLKVYDKHFEVFMINILSFPLVCFYDIV